MDLPTAIFIRIFSFLRFDDIARCQLVCQAWQEAASSEYLWAGVLMHRWRQAKKQFGRSEVSQKVVARLHIEGALPNGKLAGPHFRSWARVTDKTAPVWSWASLLLADDCRTRVGPTQNARLWPRISQPANRIVVRGHVHSADDGMGVCDACALTSEVAARVSNFTAKVVAASGSGGVPAAGPRLTLPAACDAASCAPARILDGGVMRVESWPDDCEHGAACAGHHHPHGAGTEAQDPQHQHHGAAHPAAAQDGGGDDGAHVGPYLLFKVVVQWVRSMPLPSRCAAVAVGAYGAVLHRKDGTSTHAMVLGSSGSSGSGSGAVLAVDGVPVESSTDVAVLQPYGFATLRLAFPIDPASRIAFDAEALEACHTLQLPAWHMRYETDEERDERLSSPKHSADGGAGSNATAAAAAAAAAAPAPASAHSVASSVVAAAHSHRRLVPTGEYTTVSLSFVDESVIWKHFMYVAGGLIVPVDRSDQ